jgi:phosphatidate cytidylyltransferase
MKKFLLSKEVFVRTVSALILIILVLYIILTKIELFSALVMLFAVIASFEWQALTQCNKKWQILGALLIISVGFSLMYIANNSLMLLLWLFIIVWSTDIGAYLVGKKLGGPKLAYKISPGKTWAGAFGGLFIAVAAASIFGLTAKLELQFIIYSPTISILAQLGDILESYIKRRFMVKNSGKFIPGHGGVLDRMDSLLIAAPAAALLVSLSNH